MSFHEKHNEEAAEQGQCFCEDCMTCSHGKLIVEDCEECEAEWKTKTEECEADGGHDFTDDGWAGLDSGCIDLRCETCGFGPGRVWLY
jgi:hypothetical protein